MIRSPTPTIRLLTSKPSGPPPPRGAGVGPVTVYAFMQSMGMVNDHSDTNP